MSAFAQARLEVALARIDDAIAWLEGQMDPHARGVLLKARGDITATLQLLELERELGQAVPAPPASDASPIYRLDRAILEAEQAKDKLARKMAQIEQAAAAVQAAMDAEAEPVH